MDIVNSHLHFLLYSLRTGKWYVGVMAFKDEADLVKIVANESCETNGITDAMLGAVDTEYLELNPKIIQNRIPKVVSG
jgi:hypothetical protein